ncbi:hypothetical protein CANARDRAFT_174488 [[Candida] arabinofermentans NRRL YB-2248]|uniref:Uncharacterized protein n=1 Tax=[Candida] arabinofermentans NRRL YB-2248 TaxID=983967 RepID=A0A1E4T6Q1_9ASCO|nr:hypothetical protein CANARDRAFT_174488 [[Candida] arabinofermentans NRRL YB-2248]
MYLNSSLSYHRTKIEIKVLDFELSQRRSLKLCRMVMSQLQNILQDVCPEIDPVIDPTCPKFFATSTKLQLGASCRKDVYEDDEQTKNKLYLHILH